MQCSVLYSEKHSVNNIQVWGFFPFFMTCRMDWNDQPLHRVLTLQTSQVKAAAEVLLSELGCTHLEKE